MKWFEGSRRFFSPPRLLILVAFLFLLFPQGRALAAVNVYYSVGQTSADLKTGSPTVTMDASGNAVFSVAQTGNIGVGDAVTFGNQTLYIVGKSNADQMHWSLITATGTLAFATTTATVTSIKRAFTSLATALNGFAGASAKGANFMATSSLVAAPSGGNFILNLPCYYDTGPDYQDAVAESFTTDATHYINIYTPTSTTTQANFSQQLSNGAWTPMPYHLDRSD